MNRVEITARDVVFSFNKKHLEDPSIPMWKIAAKGESYYVDHVVCSIGWSTKESPDNSHTKGSIRVKNVHLRIDDENVAYINEATPEIWNRIENKLIPVYILNESKSTSKLLESLKTDLGPIKRIVAVCSTTKLIVEIPSEELVTLIALQTNDIRELKPNEDYYQMYQQYKNNTVDEVDLDD